MLSLLIPVLALASPNLSGVKAEIEAINKIQNLCHENARSNMEMKECEAGSLNSADKLLNREYKQIVGALKAEGNDEYAVETLKRLVASQRAWITYRDANCSLESTDMLFGSGESLVMLGCLSRTTKARVLELVERFGE